MNFGLIFGLNIYFYKVCIKFFFELGVILCGLVKILLIKYYFIKFFV